MHHAGKKYIASHANQNTLLGIALTMGRMKADLDYAVFEVGISKVGEMKKMAQLLQPTTGIITYIAHTHTEGLGNLATIALEKRALFSCFKETSIGIINGDMPLLNKTSYTHPVIRFGTKGTNQIQARQIKHYGDSLSCTLKTYGTKQQITLTPDHPGRLNSALACIAMGHHLGLPAEQVLAGIQAYVPEQQRFKSCQLKDYKGVVIDDSYNASPESVKAALLAFDHLPHKGKKVAVLGDMLELGVTSGFWHRQLGKFLKKTPTVSHVVFVGKETEASYKLVPAHVTVTHVKEWSDAIPAVRATLEDDTAVLVKGSRGIQLNKVVKELVQD
jgi:UDP-N-acetylmuramoyl-tripeptide--D-alanyl-D-alanine ligase